MSSAIERPGWQHTTGPPSWTFRHESGWEVRTAEDHRDIRPYKLFAPDGSPVKIHPYRHGFVKRCQGMAIAEFFARNPVLFERLQNDA